MENNSDNPNSNIILNLQKENIQLKEQLKHFEKHLQLMQVEFNKAKDLSYLQGYKQASKDNAVNIKLSTATANGTGDIILNNALKPNSNSISFDSNSILLEPTIQSPIYSYADEVTKLIAEKLKEAKEYK